MSYADWVQGAKRKVILKFKTVVLEKIDTKRKGNLKMGACYVI